LLSLKGKLEIIRSDKVYEIPGNFRHKIIVSQLITSIQLLENLSSLRYLCFLKEKGARLTVEEIEKWNLVFENFWHYKKASFYNNYSKPLGFATPINSVKLESAILYMIDNISFKISLCNDAFKYKYHSHEINDLLTSWDKFYDPSNYENYVHLDIVHNPFDYKNLVHLDEVPDMDFDIVGEKTKYNILVKTKKKGYVA
jgi:hypothetical protein